MGKGRAPGGLAPAASFNESAAVGKVFFHDPNTGNDEDCSASTLNSPSHELVITAAHCVIPGGGGQLMQNWMFVPRYRNGAEPFGAFVANVFRVFTSWVQNGDNGRDVAMATTSPLEGQKVVDLVGGNGLAWDFSHFVDVTAFAYPGNHDSGEIQWVCQASTFPTVVDNRIFADCGFGHGASGGPWFLRFNNSTGLGLVNGVFSQGATIIDTFDTSSYFDDGVKGMFDAQGSFTVN